MSPLLGIKLLNLIRLVILLHSPDECEDYFMYLLLEERNLSSAFVSYINLLANRIINSYVFYETLENILLNSWGAESDNEFNWLICILIERCYHCCSKLSACSSIATGIKTNTTGISINIGDN